MHTIFIFGCCLIIVLLMVMLPLIRRCSPSTADKLSKRLYWGVPIRMIFEFYFILALTAWHNMKNETTDASKLIAYLVLVVLICFTLYIYYTFVLTLSVRAGSPR